LRQALPALAKAGCRSVAVTTRLYKPSSQPADGGNGFAALSEDVHARIGMLGEKMAHVMGHDWSANGALIEFLPKN